MAKRTEPRGTVLVLDQFSQTLAVVRSLGKAGFRVLLGYEEGRPIASRSRYCAETWMHPRIAGKLFEDALQSLLKQRSDVSVIFPVAEPSIRAVSQMAWLPSSGVKVAAVSPELVHGCLNKVRGHELASQAGLRVPASRTAQNLDGLRSAASALGFPLIAKPLGDHSRLFGRKAYVIESQSEFDQLFERWPSDHIEILIQRYVAGAVESSDFVAAQGRVVAYCEARTVRTDRMDGTGFGVEFETLHPSADILAATRQFATSCDYSGPGIIQFVRCADTGEIYFLENNPRLSAGVADSIACGQDMPRLVVECAAGDYQVPEFDFETNGYEVGHHAYWFQRDLEGMIARRKEVGPGAMMRWVAGVLMSVVRADSHIIWQWRDPWPGVHTYLRIAGRYVGAIRRRMLSAIRPQSQF